MSDRCLKPEELAELAADDPRRTHVEDCPRCQALLKSYAAFMDPADISADADLDDADVRLTAALDREIGLDGKVVRPVSTFWTPFRARATAAAAAVVIVAVGLSLVRPGSEVISPEDPVLRGVDGTDAPFRCRMEKQENDLFRVTWPGIAEATGYRLVVHGEYLEELEVLEVGAATTFELKIPAGAAFCRVIALRQGDELQRSDPAYFDDF